MVHLVVVYGFQGASSDHEKLRLTEKFLDAVLCELAVVASGQPRLIVGDLKIEPEKVPWLVTGLIFSLLGLLLLVLLRSPPAVGLVVLVVGSGGILYLVVLLLLLR